MADKDHENEESLEELDDDVIEENEGDEYYDDSDEDGSVEYEDDEYEDDQTDSEYVEDDEYEKDDYDDEDYDDEDFEEYEDEGGSGLGVTVEEPVDNPQAGPDLFSWVPKSSRTQRMWLQGFLLGLVLALFYMGMLIPDGFSLAIIIFGVLALLMFLIVQVLIDRLAQKAYLYDDYREYQERKKKNS